MDQFNLYSISNLYNICKCYYSEVLMYLNTVTLSYIKTMGTYTSYCELTESIT